MKRGKNVKRRGKARVAALRSSRRQLGRVSALTPGFTSTDHITTVVGRYQTEFVESSTSTLEVDVDLTPLHLDSRLLDMSDDWTYYRFTKLAVELQVRLPRTNEQTLGFLYSPLCLAYVPVIAGTADVWNKNVLWTASVYKQTTPYAACAVGVPRSCLLGETSYNWFQIATDTGTGGPDIQGTIYGGWAVQDADSGGSVQVTVSYEVELRGTQDPAVSFQRRLLRMQARGELVAAWGIDLRRAQPVPRELADRAVITVQQNPQDGDEKSTETTTPPWTLVPDAQ